jgi:hypothetical protein
MKLSRTATFCALRPGRTPLTPSQVQESLDLERFATICRFWDK